MSEIEMDEAESEAGDEPVASGRGGDAEPTTEDVTKVDADSTTPPTSPHAKPAPLPVIEKSKEPNPNADALRDVGRFQLSDDTPGLPAGFIAGGLRKRTKRKGKLVEVPGEGVKGARWYYVKPRCVSQCWPGKLIYQTRVTAFPRSREQTLRDARLHDGHSLVRRRHL